MEENVLDFTKIKCKQHPFEVVSNYCMNEKCMVGLCSNCICIHTQMHMREGTTPAYRPLKQIHRMAFDCIQSHLNVLKYDKERIVNIMKNLTDRKQNFRMLLNQAKKDVLNLVERVFEQAQMKFQQQVKNQEKKTGLHSSFQVESLCRKVNRQMEILINQAQLLNTYKFLDVVKNIKVNALNEVIKVHEEVSKQITENQQFSPTLSYKKECLVDVQVMIRRLFSLTFLYPRVNCLKMPQKYSSQYGKQNIVKMSQTCLDYKPFFNTSTANFIKTAPSTQESIRNSKIFENISIQQKTQRPSSNLSRSTSFSNMNIIPQFLDSKNFPLQIYSRNTPSQFKLTGSKIFTKTMTRQ